MHGIFRTELQKDGNLGYARQKLDIATDCYRKNEPIQQTRYRAVINVPVEDYLDAKDIYTALKNHEDYRVRVDTWRTMTVYSNDRDMLLKLANKMRISAREFWEPDPNIVDIILGQPNIIITDEKSPYRYKVTLGRKAGSTTELGNWLLNNKDKSKIGSIAIDALINNGYVDGFYFYVRDKKVLMLIQLMSGTYIRRVDKLVYKDDIDKY